MGEVVGGHQYNLKLRLLKSECAENQYISWMHLVAGHILCSFVLQKERENVFQQVHYLLQ